MALKISLTLFLLAMTIEVQTQKFYRYPTNKENRKESPIKYEFGYKVRDVHTKDIKRQHETREGNLVKGYYELIDSDGFKRMVEYSADDHHGFQAIVKRIKTDIVIPIPDLKYSKNTNLNKYKEEHYQNGIDESSTYSRLVAKKNSAAHILIQKILPKFPIKIMRSSGKDYRYENNEVSNGSSHVTFHDSVTSYHY